MKPPVKIFVEGKTDKKFINDYIRFLCSAHPENSKDIIVAAGWEKLSKAKNTFKDNTNDGGVNLVIFDTDENFAERREEILAKKKELGIQFELFLLPDNKNCGELETLLSNIINPKHKRIFSCFDKYEKCLSENPAYTRPNIKTRIYAYFEALLGTAKSQKKKIKPDKREYCNQDHWNLGDNHLNPLKDFLSAFLNM